MTRVEDSAFTCSMCLDIFVEPMECENCHNNYCKKCCQRIRKCPLCMTEPFAVRENVTLKRILMDIKFICPNNCGKSFTKEELPAHMKECQLPLVFCSVCPFQGVKEKFWLHITESHQEEIITLMSKQKQMPSSTVNSQFTPHNLAVDMNSLPMKSPQQYQHSSTMHMPNPQFSMINEPFMAQSQLAPQLNINSSTVISNNSSQFLNINALPQEETQKRFLGSNGIYYCYQPSNLNCGCCNGVCAEGNCLCKLCMNLNTKLKRLNRGDLVNKAGRVSRYSMNAYYCGDKYIDQKKNVVGFVFQQEVPCNYPNDPCSNCKALTSIVNRYL